MATTITKPPGAEQRSRPADRLEVRKPAAVAVWAFFGALLLALEVYVYVAWFARGEATGTPTGADALPEATKVWAVALQVILGVGAVAVLIWVVRKCMRERRLVFDAMLVLAWAALFWQDPLINWIRPLFFYNSYLANLGVWVMNIPGWSSPNGNLLPEPLLLIGCFYLAFGMLMTIVTSNIMRAAKTRWPRLGAISLIAIAFLAMFALDFIAEIIFVRTEMYAYPGAIRMFSLWGGHTYQFPLYEPLFVAPVLTAMGALRFFRDDKGRTMLDRGIDDVRVSLRRKTTLRVLALVAFINMVSILTYAVPMNVIGLHVDKTPSGYPSYLRNGLCGKGTRYACPGPDVPVPLRGSDTAGPPGG